MQVPRVGGSLGGRGAFSVVAVMNPIDFGGHGHGHGRTDSRLRPFSGLPLCREKEMKEMKKKVKDIKREPTAVWVRFM